MSTPYFPDIDLMWQTDDDETGRAWLELADSFCGGIIVERGAHTEDAAQVVFLLYLFERTVRDHSNFLVFDEHRDAVAEALEQWAGPLGGSTAPRYPFWRLQKHRFWRLTSWSACCDEFGLSRRARAKVAADASVGVLDERAWLALMQDSLLRHNMSTHLIAAYWPSNQEALAEYFDVPTMAFSTPDSRLASRRVRPRTKPRSMPEPPTRLTQTPRLGREYSSAQLADLLQLGTPLSDVAVTTAGHRDAALLVHDPRDLEQRTADGGCKELRWQCSNRDIDDWMIFDELGEARGIWVFVAVSEATYRCLGRHALVSVEPRKWSLFRRLHDVVLRWPG